MYESYWGLNRRPFANGFRPEFFYRSGSHRAALLKLQYVLENRLGAALLGGGIGTGKTFLTHMLPEGLPDRFGPTVRVVFPQLTPAELLAYLAVELGADESSLGSLDRTVRRIEYQLHRHCHRGHHPILVIDAAHVIDDPQTFQALQLLLNFQQHRDLEFSLILVGDPSLFSRVGRIGPLDDRLAVKTLLRPLPPEETAGYVNHRLQAAGAERPLFDEAALGTVFELSGGVPRRINRLCDLALLVGYADGLEIISADEIEAVSEELTAGIAA